jgi:dihydroneopterin aldolase
MMGKIRLKGLEYKIHIGVTEEERQQQQPVLIDVVVYLDITRAVETQNIDETVNYNHIQKTIRVFLENKEYVLVERLAADIIEVLLLSFDKIKAIKCTCWKPNALKDAENVGVTVVRKR